MNGVTHCHKSRYKAKDNGVELNLAPFCFGNNGRLTKAMTIIASKNWLRRIAKPLATIEKIKKILINT